MVGRTSRWALQWENSIGDHPCIILLKECSLYSVTYQASDKMWCMMLEFWALPLLNRHEAGTSTTKPKPSYRLWNQGRIRLSRWCSVEPAILCAVQRNVVLCRHPRERHRGVVPTRKDAMLCAWRRYKTKYYAVSTVAILIEGSESLSKTARWASISEAWKT